METRERVTNMYQVLVPQYKYSTSLVAQSTRATGIVLKRYSTSIVSYKSYSMYGVRYL